MSSQRLIFVDVVRGFAVILMVIYHFCYDLQYFEIVHFDIYHQPFWLHSRTVIVTLFVSIVGVSLSLATQNELLSAHFFKRLAYIGGSALLISIVSFILFKERFIFFGILHFITLASLLSLCFLNFFWLNIFLGISLITIGIQLQHPFFNHPLWQWIGLMTHKPATEDYVPLLPWFGIVLLGITLGHWLRNQPVNPKIVPPHLRYLAWMGQHSLPIYLIHQPLLMGGLLLFLMIQRQFYTPTHCFI